MTVVPFKSPPAAEPLAFTIGARVDLRVGALTGGVVRLRGPGDEAFWFSNLARLLRAARMAWLERNSYAPLSLAIAPSVHRDLDADLLNEAAIEAGCTRHTLSFQLCEREVLANAGSLVEDLRAQGWGVALRADPECPLPFGSHARNLYSELVVEAPDMSAAAPGAPLGRRLAAAKAAGLVLTVETVATTAQARALALAGYDRGGGPYAEALP